MKRRDFIKNTIAVSAPIMIGGVGIHTYASPVYEEMGILNADNDKVLVLIQLNGGNDGLNTVIPLDQYSNLFKARQNVIIPENRALKINDETALHPAMTEVHELYQDGMVGISQSVGYPEPNLSHFRSTDIWTSASDSDKVISTGWLGRYLADVHPEYPENYPNEEFPDPLSLTIGSIVSHTCQGPVHNMGMALNSADDFYDILTGEFGSTPDTVAGDELGFVRQMIRQTKVYFDRLTQVAEAGKNFSDKYPEGNRLANQMKIVARLINGGMRTKIYVVTIGGFDTHALQVEQNNTSEGTHSELLRQLSQAVYAFMDDVKQMGKQDKVVALTFSEFGRRIVSNLGYGTDHGTSAPIFVFGSQVNPIIHGSNPIIPDNVTNQNNLPMQFDFRSIYASVLKDWFETDTGKVNDLLYRDYPPVPLFKGVTSINDDFYRKFSAKVNPNPMNGRADLILNTQGGNTIIELYDNTGRKIANIYRGMLQSGETKLDINSNGIPSGIYYLNIRIAGSSFTKPLIVKK